VDRMDLRAIDSDGAHDRLLLTWNPGPLSWRWSPDGARLFAVLPGDWDWQLWEIPLDGDAPRDLVREAAGISDLAVAPDGGRVAVVAEPSLDYGRHRGEVFVIEPSSGDAQRFNLSGDDARSVAWLDGDSLLVVVADSTFPVLPEHRTLRRLRFSDGSLLPFP
jgi:dipeptidyl aminopeptidase/acylaminoacyl peptidase